MFLNIFSPIFVVGLGVLIIFLEGQSYKYLSLKDNVETLNMPLYLLFIWASLMTRFVLTLVLDLLTVRLSRNLHRSISENLLRASFPKFYNLTLAGRLMNRLSNDIFQIDQNLSMMVQQVIIGFIHYFATIYQFFVIESYYIIPVQVVYLIYTIWFFFYYMRTQREVMRLDTVSKSPILNLQNEVAAGSIYCRTCLSPEYLIRRQRENLNVDIRNNILLNGLRSFMLSY